MAIDEKYLHSDITNSVLQAFYTVVKTLPYGLDIMVYKRALAVELDLLTLKTEPDYAVNIYYKQKVVGSFTMDMVVADRVIIKVIRDDSIKEQHDIEAKNWLRLTEYAVCLILNFDFEGQHKRLVLTNDLKLRN
jgi:GxxExxY protein